MEWNYWAQLPGPVLGLLPLLLALLIVRWLLKAFARLVRTHERIADALERIERTLAARDGGTR